MIGLLPLYVSLICDPETSLVEPYARIESSASGNAIMRLAFDSVALGLGDGV